MRGVHHGLLFAVLGSEPSLHPGEGTLVAPPLPLAVERLVRPAGGRRATSAQAIAVDQYYSAQHTLFVNTRLPMRLQKERFNARHLRVGQPEKIRHVTDRFSNRDSRSAAEINGS
jgi:hypothetical protein